MERHGQSRLLQRRVATAPTLLQPPPKTQRSREKSESDVDTIFNHANAKVISLVALSDQTFSLDSSNRDTIGPWQSHFERTIAIGSLRLYRAPGSVVFLSCGSALQPMFPKSQCWCMEEDGSKFVLQIRPPSYWRIELASPNPPGNSLRDCLESVLLLDKTPCPFKESVPIFLPPESPPAKKQRPWKPLRSYPSEPILSKKSENVYSYGQLLKAGHDRGRIAQRRGDYANERVEDGDQDGGLCHVTDRPEAAYKNVPHDTFENEAGLADVSLEDQPGGIDEPGLQTSCRQSAPNADERGCFSEGISYYSAPIVTQASALSARDSPAVARTNHTDIPSQPSEGQPQGNPAIDVDGTRVTGRRYTIASSGHETELMGFIQRRGGDSMRSQKTMNRQDIQTTVYGAESDEVFGRTVSKPVMVREASPFTTHHPHRIRHSTGLRQRRRELIDARSTEAGGHDRDEDSANAPSDISGSAQADSLPKAMLLLLYTILGIIVLIFRIVGIGVIGWWKPTEDAQHNCPQRLQSGARRPMRGDYDALTLNGDCDGGE